MTSIDTPGVAASDGSPRLVRDVVCGFCGLGCDDLEIEVSGRAVRARGTVCPEAAKLFLRRGEEPDRSASRAGEACSQDDAASAARDILAAARSPLIAGLGADIDGGRAIVDLAATFGGVLDHSASVGLFRNFAATQRTGWLASTLAEVRNRCDVLLVVGDDPTSAFGRLFERLYPADPLFAKSRRVIFLGAAPGERALKQLDGVAVSHLPASDPVAALEALNGLVAGRRITGETIGGVPLPALADTAAALQGAAYAVATWNAAEFAEGDLVAERVTALIDALNVTTRAGVFPLGGRDNIIGINQLLLWRLGYPLRTAIRGGVSAHDPDLFAAANAVKDADVLVWVSAFRPEPPPASLVEDFAGKIIVLGHPDTPFDRDPDVFIPVGTPGIDHAGTVFRMDSIVSLPLGALRVATLPGVAEAVRRIAGAVA
ncbi:formylmethanofuran dehydrogenase [Bosea sp. 117]|uniref:formylmethanofuran dehydrogenase n=1 Tax=Bosea sp. 117 TaxID=1125973 RepID=UPI00056E33B5|nr:formylmethanofuran dehydrogenase [Bosea sp. 117]